MRQFYVFIGLFFQAAFAFAEQPLRVVSETLPPYQIIDDEGQFGGRAVDMVQAILDEAGFDSPIDVMPWARAYKTAQKEKNVAIFAIAFSEKRKDLFHWIGALYALERSSLIGLKNRSELAKDSLEEAKQFRVCSELETYSYQYLVNKGFVPNENLFTLRATLFSIQTNSGGVARPARHLLLLQNRKCDYVTGLWSVYAYSENNNNDLEPYFYLGDPKKPLILNLAISLSSDQEVIDRLSTAYQTLFENGTLHQICTRDDPELTYELSCSAIKPTDHTEDL
ncbi:transporter substrate-binding domain-containing protein [Grimontia kaedaensis]|uniref:Transporter substrate-binding domain-containing protein n=1 Tax=Grimontia kaedaensis TaxID=2872157 RepID=A0ABY4X127_9GAMM|nr:transporter substrate-binding domain-containing protein [Grimontia kaedaensis]USH04969.1 transporter substrate-binding domain-containing protein [Grimontia kaedaensis]